MRTDIERLVRDLVRRQVDLTPLELAESLLLASAMGPRDVATDRESETVRTAPQDIHEPVKPALHPRTQDGVRGTLLTNRSTSRIRDGRIPIAGMTRGANAGGATAVNIPAAAALPHSRGIARAIRPLKRRYPSRTRRAIDEDATVRAIAEEGLWRVVERPASERWLRLALVVDVSPSMTLWQDEIAEFHRLLCLSGIFGTLERWELNCNGQKGIELYPAGSRGTLRSARELLDPSHRLLILIVSDCVAKGWYDGSAVRFIEPWTKARTASLVQVLPPTLWRRTALARGRDLWLRSDTTCYWAPLTNRYGEIAEDQDELPAIPILNLEQRWFSRWADLVAGVGGATARGTAFSLAGSWAASAAKGDVPSVSLEQRLDQFRRSASPAARRLATYLSVVPLTLPVMRLVRAEMLPRCSLAELAEVLLSGLVVKAAGAADGREYDFIPGAREELARSLPNSEVMSLLSRIGDFVGARIKQPFDFTAWLFDPIAGTPAADVEFPAEARVFANVASAALARLGGRYAEIARRLAGEEYLSSAASEEWTNDLPLLKQMKENLRFAPETKLSDSVKAQMIQSLAEFHQYFQQLGHQPNELERSEINVRTDDPWKTLQTGVIAFYNPDTSTIFINPAYGGSEYPVLRQYAHRILYASTAVTDFLQAPQSLVYSWQGLEYGLADYFPASFRNRSKLEAIALPNDGAHQDLIVDLNDSVSFETVASRQIDQAAAAQKAWATALWEIRNRLGKEATDLCVYRAWCDLKPAGVRVVDHEFEKALLLHVGAAAGAPGEQAVREILLRRGFYPEQQKEDRVSRDAVGRSKGHPTSTSRPYFTASELALAYAFPEGDGAGQVLGLIELGGGYLKADLRKYFSKVLGIKMPNVTPISIDGARNQPRNREAGSQATLDIEIAGAVAPAAEIRVYFAPNTDRGMIDALVTATRDRVSVILINWGGTEASWGQERLLAVDNAVRAAALHEITVVAPSGDGGCTDRSGDGQRHVVFPASSPWVLAVGGTTLTWRDGAVISEVAWNSGDGQSATGGGVSDFFERPAWQSDTPVPGGRDGKAGRGIPDVAANADPRTGCLILHQGRSIVLGGTSAAAALWAGLIARINQQLGKNVGYLTPKLYQRHRPPGALRNITSGNNNMGDVPGYSAGPGWNAVTGWGSPNGRALLEALRVGAT